MDILQSLTFSHFGASKMMALLITITGVVTKSDGGLEINGWLTPVTRRQNTYT